MSKILNKKYDEFFEMLESPMGERVLMSFCYEHPEYGLLYSTAKDYMKEIKKNPNVIIENILKGCIDGVKDDIETIGRIED